jgi:hypothetical protein
MVSVTELAGKYLHLFIYKSLSQPGFHGAVLGIPREIVEQVHKYCLNFEILPDI